MAHCSERFQRSPDGLFGTLCKSLSRMGYLLYAVFPLLEGKGLLIKCFNLAMTLVGMLRGLCGFCRGLIRADFIKNGLLWRREQAA